MREQLQKASAGRQRQEECPCFGICFQGFEPSPCSRRAGQQPKGPNPQEGQRCHGGDAPHALILKNQLWKAQVPELAQAGQSRKGSIAVSYAAPGLAPGSMVHPVQAG
eukprot:CAMPEP_0202924782 /NCGR_PEP_ID=MMETSP1392-20130828/79158_1 /ASSEMBLY_ACC=CAM_ASM_000868 /TAXON_ID=225041 /ORGANISM="Chlamydomonas chlamydogama, Strain SAG 11-48b" /LENGTH=107 /DNA_ID=CAMNT_0049618537 /DNA_START=653 /DNA_END=977 /DNA_ORIENTATION=-